MEKIIKFLFSSNIPLLEFPETNIYDGNPDWGWIDRDINTLFLPRKTFYLPNDELVDTAVHEACHFLSGSRFHNHSWYKIYLQQRKKVFANFADFINSLNQQAKFEKGYKIYPDHYVN